MEVALFAPCPSPPTHARIHRVHRRFTDPATLITWAGYVGLTAIIFTETGLLFGFFLPGDSLLVTAGSSPRRGS
jgi:membrane-associated protein